MSLGQISTHACKQSHAHTHTHTHTCTHTHTHTHTCIRIHVHTHICILNADRLQSMVPPKCLHFGVPQSASGLLWSNDLGRGGVSLYGHVYNRQLVFSLVFPLIVSICHCLSLRTPVPVNCTNNYLLRITIHTPPLSQ